MSLHALARVNVAAIERNVAEYEIVCEISARVARRYHRDGAL